MPSVQQTRYATHFGAHVRPRRDDLLARHRPLRQDRGSRLRKREGRELGASEGGDGVAVPTKNTVSRGIQSGRLACGKICRSIERVQGETLLWTEPSADKSEAVVFATLKTIGVFLNCDGRHLFAGVTDQSDSVGIERDFIFCKKPDCDASALTLRDEIQTSFRSGTTLNDFVDTQVARVDEFTVARVAVAT